MSEAKGFKQLHSRMQSRKLAIVMLMLAGCAADTELLNSERIRQTFGSYGITVLPGSGTERRSSLYSLEAGERVTRTYAVVLFNEALTPAEKDAIRPVHAQILAGASIGATFRQNDWTISKQNLYTGHIELSDTDTAIMRLMHLNAPQDLAMHVYRFNIKKDRYFIDYAMIIEVHHPAYLNRKTLAELYPADPAEALAPQQVDALRRRVRTGS